MNKNIRYVMIGLFITIVIVAVYLIITSGPTIKESDLDGYELVNLSEDELKGYSSVNDEYEERFFEIKDSVRFKIPQYDNEYIDFIDGKLSFIYNGIVHGNLPLAPDPNSNYTSLNDFTISKVYYLMNGHTNVVYVITNNGQLYRNDIYGGFEFYDRPSSDESVPSFEKVNLSYSVKAIDDIVITEEGTEGSVVDEILLGEDGKKYSLTENRVYDYAYVMHDYELVESEEGTTLENKNTAYIKTNRDVEINGKIIDYKFRNSFVYISEYSPQEPAFFVTTTNQLYSIKKKDIVNANQIKGIYYKYNEEEFGEYIVVFEDDKYIKFDGNNEQIDTQHVMNEG